MSSRNLFPAWLGDLKHQHGFFDDFYWYISPHMWTNLLADTTPTVTILSTEPGGILNLYTDTTDENEVGVFTTNELFKLAAGKSFRAGVRLQFTELTGNGANVAFGFADAAGANLLGDAGAGVAAGLTTAILIYKTDGSTVWKLYSENGSDTESHTSTVTAGGASYQELEIFGEVVDGSIDEYQITFKIDGVPFYDSNGRIISHKISYASATDMDFGIYAKTGTSGEALTVKADWIYTFWDR